jgi:DNA-binding winged helix-turn-helix (wHTH) protein
VWHGAADDHAVEVTVGRLRRRLDGVLRVETVPRRGYRLVGPTIG